MAQYIIITEEEIINTPNDFDLGRLIRMKYFKCVNENKKCQICGADKPCTPEKDEECQK